MKNLIILSILFLLFTVNVSSDDIEIETLLNILSCLEKKDTVNKTKVVSLIHSLNNYNPYTILKVYNFLQDSIIQVNQCTHYLRDVPDSLKRYIYPYNKELSVLNWKDYLKCLYDFNKGNIKSLKNFIELIESKNYYDAMFEEKKLLIAGDESILICAHVKSDINSSNDYRTCSIPKYNEK